jgi:hypothetical protein
MSRLPTPLRTAAILLSVGGQRLPFGIRARSEFVLHALDLLLGGDDPAWIRPLQFQRLSQPEQVLLTPVSQQRFLDRFRAGLDARIAQLG